MAEQNAIHQKFFWVMNIRYIAYKKLGAQRYSYLSFTLVFYLVNEWKDCVQKPLVQESSHLPKPHWATMQALLVFFWHKTFFLSSLRPLTWRDAFVLDLLRKYRNERFVNIINKVIEYSLTNFVQQSKIWMCSDRGSAMFELVWMSSDFIHHDLVHEVVLSMLYHAIPIPCYTITIP